MPTLHLIKLSVGPDSLADLAAWQNQRLPEKLMHITRHKPKRAAEILDGGSIYWVVKSVIVARQQILEFRDVTKDGIASCGIVYGPTLIPVHNWPRRAFQGWRYLDAKDAPPDHTHGANDDPSDTLRQDLAALGLI